MDIQLIGIIQNAIGYEIYKDGREAKQINGINSIELSDEEIEITNRAAKRVLNDLSVYFENLSK